MKKIMVFGLLALLCIEIMAMDYGWWQSHEIINQEQEEEEKIARRDFNKIQEIVRQNPSLFKLSIQNTHVRNQKKYVKSADFNVGANNWHIILEYFPSEKVYAARLEKHHQGALEPKYIGFSEKQAQQLYEEVEKAQNLENEQKTRR